MIESSDTFPPLEALSLAEKIEYAQGLTRFTAYLRHQAAFADFLATRGKTTRPDLSSNGAHGWRLST